MSDERTDEPLSHVAEPALAEVFVPAAPDLAADAPAVADLAAEAPAVATLAADAPAVATLTTETPTGMDLATEAPTGMDLAAEAPAVADRVVPASVAVATLQPVAPSAPLPWWRVAGRRSRRRRLIQAAVSLLLLATLGLSLAHAATYALDEEHHLVALASQGIAALRRVPEDVGLGVKALPTQRVTPAQIAQAQADAAIALADFTALNDTLSHPDIYLSNALRVPKYAALLRSAALLSPIAMDVAHVEQTMITALVAVANTLASSSLIGNAGTSADPGLSMSDLRQIADGFQRALPRFTDILARLNAAPAAVLFAALTTKQRAEMQPILALLPKIPAFLPVIEQFITVAPQILGIGQPANYLLLTLDSAEMRPTGGFQGNDAIFSVQGGRVGTVSLQDVYLLDGPYTNSSPGDAATPPAIYQSWWPPAFLPWGLRDANLSPDFLTSAGYDLAQLRAEGGDAVPVVDSNGQVTGHTPATVTGVIAIEPAVIAQLIDLTGPVTLGTPYNVTITSANLEDEIHYYQLTNQGRQTGTQTGTGQQLSDPNKRFTALLGHTLLQRLKALPKSTLLQFAQTAIADLSTKDIQVAFTDPAAEDFLRAFQASATLYNGAQDSLALIGANISGNKASQYLSASMVDTIQLDAQGGATHTLTIHYLWDPPVIQDGADQNAVYAALYNADHYDYNGLFYWQYVRLYTAPGATVNAASGFEKGGVETTVSDLPGRGMFGAHTLFLGDATAHPVTWTVPSVTISWYAPQVYMPGQAYELHVQRQAGASESLSVAIQPPACAGQATTLFSGALTTNWALAVPVAAC